MRSAICDLWVKPIACTSRFQFDDMQSVLRAWHHLTWYVLLGICWSNIFKFPAVWLKLSFFQVHLWNPVWSMPALGPWHWVAWGKAATTAESWEPKKIAIGYWIKMFLIVVAICRIISFDGFSGEEQSGENKFLKLTWIFWKFLETYISSSTQKALDAML